MLSLSAGRTRKHAANTPPAHVPAPPVNNAKWYLDLPWRAWSWRGPAVLRQLEAWKADKYLLQARGGGCPA
jgi:hypothetical protein